MYETEIQENRTEYSIFYSALLQKRPVIVRSLLIVATPYQRIGRTRDEGIWGKKNV